MIISVTGKSGSGKSLIARKIANKLDFTYVDVDKIGHSIYEDEGLCKALVELFGEQIMTENGKIDRKRISKIIFSNPNSNLREQFNVLTWQPMKNQIDEIIASNKNVVLDWINLPLTEYWDKSALKILIDGNTKTRYEVLKNRDKLTEEQLALRENGAPSYLNCHPNFTYRNYYNNLETIAFVNHMVQEAKQKINKDMGKE